MNGNLIKRLRLIKGVTPKEISEFLGIKESTYLDIESGKTGLATKHIMKFCEFYNITPNQYFGVEKIVVEIENENITLRIRKQEF